MFVKCVQCTVYVYVYKYVHVHAHDFYYAHIHTWLHLHVHACVRRVTQTTRAYIVYPRMLVNLNTKFPMIGFCITTVETSCKRVEATVYVCVVLQACHCRKTDYQTGCLYTCAKLCLVGTVQCT